MLADKHIKPQGDLQTILNDFESLGDSCEFGFVQRHAGAEPISLFRWLGLAADELALGNFEASLPAIVSAVRNNFEGIDKSASLTLQPVVGTDNRMEYEAVISCYGLAGLTGMFVENADPDKAFKRYTGFLMGARRLLLSVLKEGQKILVFRTDGVHRDEEVAELHEALRAHGPNTLLWAALADDRHPPGSVERLADGFYKGRVDRFAPYGKPKEMSLQSWLHLAQTAHAMIKGSKG